LRDHEIALTRRRIRVAVVTFEDDVFARSYVAETGLDWPLLIDADRALYHGYDMLSAGFWDVWGVRTWWAYVRELLKGQKVHASAGDVMQRGGDVLIDPDGIVRLHHVGTGPADRPAVETILALVDACIKNAR